MELYIQVNKYYHYLNYDTRDESRGLQVCQHAVAADFAYSNQSVENVEAL